LENIIVEFNKSPGVFIFTLFLIVFSIYGASTAISNIDKYFSNKREKKFNEKMKPAEERFEMASAFDISRSYRYESQADMLIQSVASFLKEKDKEREKELKEAFGSISKEDRIKGLQIGTD